MDSNGRPSKIFLRGNLGTRFEEARAGGAISPGHLGMMNSSGQIVVHATAAGTNVARLVVTEEMRIFEGKTKDDAYASGDLVSYRPASRGDEFQMRLETGANVAIGAKLESNGAGLLQALTTGDAIAEALEAVDASAGEKWINVRIL